MSRLGDFLMQEGLLTLSDRRLIRRESSVHNGSFARSVLAVGIVSEEELSALLAAKTSFRRAQKDILHELDPEMEQLVPSHILAWLEVLPLSQQDEFLSVAMLDPTDLDATNQIKFFTGMRVRPVIATRSEILRGLRKIGAELPLDANPFEHFIKTHARSSAEGVLVSAGNQDQRLMSQSETIGVHLVQNPKKQEVIESSVGTSQKDLENSNTLSAGLPDQSSSTEKDSFELTLPSIEISQRSEKNAEFDNPDDLPMVDNSELKVDVTEKPEAISNAKARSKPERLDMLSLGLGALTETKADFVGHPRVKPPELTIAVQAAMSILNRFTVKLQMTNTVEDVIHKFLESMKKAGLNNGMLARIKDGKVDLAAHWREIEFDVTSGLGLPQGLDETMLDMVANVRPAEHPWVEVKQAFGEAVDEALCYWSGSSAIPESLFVVERENGVLICLVSFSGQYDHDGLRQIFYDSLRSLNSRV